MTTDEQRDQREARTGETNVDSLRPESAQARSTTKPQPANTANTQVGQVFQELERLTRRLSPSSNTARNRSATGRTTRRQAAPSRERLASLIAALGDTAHPQHALAVDELITIGDAAVPSLVEALESDQSWLTAYRAAEALGHIGDGRATDALLQALNHSNSNVRWSAVRALAMIGDARTIFQLRRVAQDDRSKTSWGESVAGAAQSALTQIREQSPIMQGMELIKTAITCVLMIIALVAAFGVITSLRQELERFGQETVDAGVTLSPLPRPTTTGDNVVAGQPTPDLLPTEVIPPTATSSAEVLVTGSVLQQAANVRAVPSSVQNEPIGRLSPGDEIVFLAVTSDGEWYKIRLGDRHAAGSQIASEDGTGWVNQALVSDPDGPVPLADLDSDN